MRQVTNLHEAQEAVDSGVLASVIVSVERPLQLATRHYRIRITYVFAEAALSSSRQTDLEYLYVLHELTPAESSTRSTCSFEHSLVY